MSGRIQKKAQPCHALGYETCHRVAEFPSCHRCTQNQKPCDSFLMSDLTSIMKEQARLKERRKETEDELIALQAEMKSAKEEMKLAMQNFESRMQDFETCVSERFGRLHRLEVQERFLHNRGVEILLREEELDREEQEAKEREEREREELERQKGAEPQGEEAIPSLDWEAIDASWEVDPALLALVDQGAGGGTDPQSSRQSPNVS
ncbi:hypothetical protein F5Y08DRAFT_300139 [Xylaria arbuscula]|nr:hypothetical protein F5Y08DRAFT_300139 [Xylaria arbuscula]